LIGGEIMDVTEIPFNKMIGIKRAVNNKYLLMINKTDDNINHIGTIHAGMLFSLAEASSGEYLIVNFNEISDKIVPILRKSEIKYSKPGNGKIYSTGFIEDEAKVKMINELESRGRTMISVEVKLEDEKNEIVFKGIFDWFLTKINK
jgi:thioesterase domain-containing protein